MCISFLRTVRNWSSSYADLTFSCHAYHQFWTSTIVSGRRRWTFLFTMQCAVRFLEAGPCLAPRSLRTCAFFSAVAVARLPTSLCCRWLSIAHITSYVSIMEFLGVLVGGQPVVCPAHACCHVCLPLPVYFHSGFSLGGTTTSATPLNLPYCHRACTTVYCICAWLLLQQILPLLPRRASPLEQHYFQVDTCYIAVFPSAFLVACGFPTLGSCAMGWRPAP